MGQWMVAVLAAVACASAIWVGMTAEDRLQDAVLGQLHQWLRPRDGWVDLGRVALRRQGGAGRGIVAKKMLKKGDVVARIPLAQLVNIEHAIVEFGKKFPDWKEEMNNLSDLDLMAAFLLYERRKGEHSQWDAFWKTLPANVSDSSLFYCPAKLNVVKATDEKMYHEIHNLQEEIHKRWETSQLLHTLSESVEKFKTAIALVQSRSFSVPVKDRQGQWHQTKCLVPFADMLNTCVQEDQNADCRTNEESTHFECFATKEIAVASFLCVPYTDSDDNTELLMNYGFALTPSASHARRERELRVKQLELDIASTAC